MPPLGTYIHYHGNLVTEARSSKLEVASIRMFRGTDYAGNDEIAGTESNLFQRKDVVFHVIKRAVDVAT